LAIIRVSQGLARLRFNDQVEKLDIIEALRLIEASRSSINDDDTSGKIYTNPKTDTMSEIFLLIKNLCSSREDKTCALNEIEKKVLSKGFKHENFKETMENYISLGVLYINNSKSEITLI
jgi:DNA replication licensing factor MCM7